MLKLIPNPTFKAPVKITGPDAKEHTITVEYRHRSKDDLKALLESPEWKDGGDVANVLTLAVSWEGVDAPMSEETLKVLFQHYYGAPRLITEAYFSSQAQARLGN